MPLLEEQSEARGEEQSQLVLRQAELEERQLGRAM